jgi:hypothetical protein
MLALHVGHDYFPENFLTHFVVAVKAVVCDFWSLICDVIHGWSVIALYVERADF